jgi:alkylation response protein AidB-like acyl-CoA dehydrogenase
MDFALTPEQERIRTLTRQFAEDEVRPSVAERDRGAIWPTELLPRMGELGFMGIATGKQYGGQGLDYVSYAVMIEELSRVDAALGVIASVTNSLVCYGLEKYGTEEQKRHFLVPLARGEHLGSFSLSEPGAGSDAAAQKTTAVREGDYYLINGTKNWVTSGSRANTILLMAMTDPERGNRGITCFIVDTTQPGARVNKIEDKLGLRSVHAAQMVVENYRVHKDRVLGEEGMGFRIALTLLNAGRIGIAAQAVGIAQGAYELARDYAKQREQFGQPIAQFQAVGFTLADMATRTKAARLLTWEAAARKDRGDDYVQASSMAKLFASETAMWVATKAVQIYGSNGYSHDFPVERYFRDAKVTEIYEGTSEIQRLVISRELLKDEEA